MYLLITFCVAFLLQIYFYLFLFRKFSFYKQNPIEACTSPVSVVICAKNEASNLKYLIPILLNQKYPEFEILFVNDASNDMSLSIMKKFQRACTAASISINIIDICTEDSIGKKYALSQGIKNSKYELILLTDADCQPVSNYWIQEMTKHFTPETSLILGYGAYKKIKGSFLNKLIRFETLLTAIQYFSYALLGKPYMGVGRNLAYRKQSFLNADGFTNHTHLLSGDDDLFVSQVATKENTKISLENKSFTSSEVINNFSTWIKQKRRHITTSKHYKRYHKLMLGLFYISQLTFYILAIAGIIGQYYLQVLIPLIIIRFTIWYTIIIKSSIRLNEKDLICLGPLYEISVIFIQLYIFLKNTISPPKHW